MDLTPANVQTWAMTIRCNKKKEADERDLFEYLAYAMSKGAILKEMYFEKDSGKTYNGLHAHGIIELKKGYLRKRLMKDGYHIKLEELYNKEGWLKYIRKSEDKIFVNCNFNYEPTDEDIKDLAEYNDEYRGNIFNDLKKKKLSKYIVEENGEGKIAETESWQENEKGDYR